MPGKFVEYKPHVDSEARIRVYSDKIELIAGDTWLTISKTGIVENGQKTTVAGGDGTATMGGLTKPPSDMQRLMPSLIVAPQPQRMINVPLTPILNLVKFTAFMTAFGIAVAAASSAASAALKS